MKHQIKHSKTLHGITLEIVNEDYLPKAQWHIVFDFSNFVIFVSLMIFHNMSEVFLILYLMI